MKVITNHQKESVYNHTRRVFVQYFPEFEGQGGACLVWTMIAGLVLHKRGLQPILQAGSMSWPFIPRHLDDGKSANAFQYFYSPAEAPSVVNQAFGGLPELHCWLGFKPYTIIDFSTGFIRRHAEAAGLVWKSPDPPLFLFGQPPEGVQYIPDKDATILAGKKIRELAQLTQVKV